MAEQKVVVNLASQEYFRAVDRRVLKARVIDCVFEEGSADGEWKVVHLHVSVGVPDADVVELQQRWSEGT